MPAEQNALKKITIVPHFMRIHEWIAEEENLFQQEGLEAEFKSDLMTGALKNADGNAGRGEQPDYAEGGACASSACEWGVIRNAGAGNGKVLHNVYGVAPYAIFVKPDSGIERLSDLRNRPVGVMLRAGSHFTTLKALELCMPEDAIRIKGSGGPSNRLDELLRGDVDAVTLLDPEIVVAEQMGLKKLAQGEFRTLFYIFDGVDNSLTEPYLKVLKKADDMLRANPDKYMKHWEKNARPEFVGNYDFTKCGLGELLFFEEYGKDLFDANMNYAKKWGLANDVTSEDYTDLTV